MKKQEKKGFTIIEVVLVLAIAGMIFLMVFIALPQMRRNQRDAERKDDMMLFAEALKKFQTNNRGALPGSIGETDVDVASRPTEAQRNDGSMKDTDWAAFYYDYLQPGFADPENDNYALRIETCNASNRGETCSNNVSLDYTDYVIHVMRQATCVDDYTVLSNNPRDFALLYRTENSGMYCYAANS